MTIPKLISASEAACGQPPPTATCRHLAEHGQLYRNVPNQVQLLAQCRAICCAGEGFSEEGVAASTHGLATAVLDQGAVSEDACLMRAAAQLYACAACIGTDAAATQLMQTVCKDMAQTPLPAR